MKKQLTLNMDALLILTLIFLTAIGFISYQRSQYSSLLEEHVQLQWVSQNLEINVGLLKAKLKQCGETGLSGRELNEISILFYEKHITSQGSRDFRSAVAAA